MEERIKMVEGKVDLALNQLAQMDKVLGVVAQWVMSNKAFFDTLQVQKQESPIIKPEEVK